MRGFTAIELLLVVAILTIVAGLAVPRFAGALVEHRIESAAQRVARDLELARQQAKARSSAVTVSFDTTAESYMLVGIVDPDHPDQGYDIELDEPPYEADIGSVSLGGDAVVIFDGYGLPDTTGTIVVQIGDRTRVIAIRADGDIDVGQFTLDPNGVIIDPNGA